KCGEGPERRTELAKETRQTQAAAYRGSDWDQGEGCSSCRLRRIPSRKRNRGTSEGSLLLYRSAAPLPQKDVSQREPQRVLSVGPILNASSARLLSCHLLIPQAVVMPSPLSSDFSADNRGEGATHHSSAHVDVDDETGDRCHCSNHVDCN